MRTRKAIEVGKRPARSAAITAVATSVALHAFALVHFAALSIAMPEHERDLIPLTLARPAPPPLPAVFNDIPGRAAHARPFWTSPQPKPEPPKPKREPPKSRPIAPRTARVEEPYEAQAPPAEPAAPAAEDSAPAGGSSAGIAGGSPAGKPGSLVGGTGDTVLRLDQVASAPHVLSSVPPQYPPVARARGREGIVVIEAVVGRDGKVEPDGLHVVQSDDPFDASALAAFRHWRFTPGRNARGEAVRVVVRQAIRFQLR